MGEIFFVVRMTIYTFLLVIFMQIKIGQSTIEEKVIDFTHNSQMAGLMQEVAQGAAKFIGVQYRNVSGHINSSYIDKYSEKNKPGQRLKTRLNELKESLNKNWEEKIEKENQALPEKEDLSNL